LLAIISLTNIVLAAIACMQPGMYARPELAVVVVPILLVTAGAYAAAYGLARYARTTASASIVVGTQLLVPILVANGLSAQDVDARSTGAWLSLAVLTASATLGSREVVAVGAIALLAMIAVMGHLAAPATRIGEAALFLGAATLLIFVYVKHRDGLERDRQNVLRARNDELEGLRSTLEVRVSDRTRELANTASELAKANEALQFRQALLVQTEKMAAVGRLTAGIAHELASPLSAILGAVDELRALAEEYERSIGDASVTDADHRAIVADLRAATALARVGSERAIKFVRGIRAHTRDPGPRATERFFLDAVVAETVELLGHAARAVSVRVTVEAPDGPVEVSAVPSRVNQVVTNLLKNAIDALGSAPRRASTKGVVTLRVRRDGADAVLEIADDGPGIAPEVVPRIFEPLFTTKSYGQGTGLGLSIVKEIVESELHGTISLQTELGVGTTFVVRFPTHDGAGHGA
jgi:signal transduction histidine kinase